jgi:hypothetical protein
MAEKDKLEAAQAENAKLKEKGCQGGNPDRMIKENLALRELIKYIYELRKLDSDKTTVHKDTKKMVETRVQNLMRRYNFCTSIIL